MSWSFLSWINFLSRLLNIGCLMQFGFSRIILISLLDIECRNRASRFIIKSDIKAITSKGITVYAGENLRGRKSD